MATVEDLPTARVTGQYLFVSQDNADEGTRPNAVLVTGYVRFTCSATPPILYKNKRVSAVPLVHDAAFDSEGFLIPLDPAQNMPIVVNGKLERGIELLADSPEASPRGFTWNVSFNLREVITGRTIQIPAFDILVKEGEDYDLVDYMPVGRSNGVGIIKGDSAYELAVANGFKGTQEEWLESIKGASGDGYVIPQMQIAPREDIPTITESRIDIWAGAPTIEGSAGWYREKRVDAGERAPGVAQGDGKPLDLNGSSYFSYPALPAASDWANNSGRVVMSDYKPGGEGQYANWLFNVEFITSSPEVEFFMNAGTTNGRFGTVLVNGKRISERAIRHTAEAGTGVGVKLTFPSAKERTIRVYGLNNGAGRFGGVAVAQGYTVVKPKVRPARKIAFIGDSFVNGTSEVSNTETFIWRLADLLGADEVLQAGIGGTGFASGDVATRFANRIDMVLAYNPDVIVFAGGRNDSANGLQEAVTNTLARAGNKELYVVSTASDATQAAVNDALAAGAAAAGIPFVRADVDALPREDAVHLTYAGHQAFADQLFARLISMKANSIPTEQAVAGYIISPSSPVYKAVESTTRRTAQPIVGELVTQAIAADGTISSAAIEAVDGAVTELDLVKSSDTRLPTRGKKEGVAFSVTDDRGNRTYLEANDSTGGPTQHSLNLMAPAVREHQDLVTGKDKRLPASENIRGTSFAVLDSLGRPVWLQANDTNGGPTPFAVSLLKSALNSDATTYIADGDSITQGGHGGGTPNNWPAYLGELLGKSVINRGRSGSSGVEAAMRQGGLTPVVTIPGGVLPANGSAVPVTLISPTTADGAFTGGASHGTRTYDGTFEGIPAQLTENVDDSWTIKRINPGTADYLATPQTPFIIDGLDPKATRIFWPGRNDYPKTNVLANIDKMAKWTTDNGGRFLVLSILTRSGVAETNEDNVEVRAVNNAIQAKYPRNFVNVRDWLVRSGLAAAGLEPTEADSTAMSAGGIPPSLMADTLHPNASGRIAIAKYVHQQLVARNWA